MKLSGEQCLNFFQRIEFLILRVRSGSGVVRYNFGCFCLCKFDLKKFHNSAPSHIHNTLLFFNLQRGVDFGRSRLV